MRRKASEHSGVRASSVKAATSSPLKIGSLPPWVRGGAASAEETFRKKVEPPCSERDENWDIPAWKGLRVEEVTDGGDEPTSFTPHSPCLGLLVFGASC